MSYVSKYTSLRKIDEDMGYCPRINDLEGLKEFLKKYNDSFIKHMVTVEPSNTYPKYEHLLGFKSYDHDDYNIDNIGYDYDKKEFLDFWLGISKFTEPFYFYTTYEMRSGFEDIIEYGITIVKVTCKNGKISVEEKQVYEIGSKFKKEEK